MPDEHAGVRFSPYEIDYVPIEVKIFRLAAVHFPISRVRLMLRGKSSCTYIIWRHGKRSDLQLISYKSFKANIKRWNLVEE